MITRLNIPHDYQFSRLSWTLDQNSPGKVPIFTCPNGHKSVMKNHKIDADGTVQGSVQCPGHNCTFHEFVVLEGWQTS